MILSRDAVLSEASDNNFLRGNSFSPLQLEQRELSVQNLFMALLVNLCNFL